MSTLLQMALLAVLAAFAMAILGGSEAGVLLAAAVGALTALHLRDARRIRGLEERLEDVPPPSWPAVPSDPMAPPRPEERPEDRTRAPAPAPRRPRRPRRRTEARPRASRPPLERASSGPEAGSLEAVLRDGLARAVAFVTGGNLVARVALLVLFVAVGLFIRYAAEQGLLPIEVRLGAAAAFGAVLVGVGWRLRATSEALALTLQGGGMAILYLTIYAAYAFYALLPSLAAIVLMAAVSVGGAALALVQDAPALVLIGVLGGFMAPVLAGTDAGHHVLLFSYYTLLNLGVLGIAWQRGWRSVALLGFGCTFVTGALWGGLTYRPELYATTQPFLIAFFAIYLVLAIRFALRSIRRDAPPERVLAVDGTLVFGLPAATFVLQRGLVEAVPYGDAWSASALAIVYLVTVAWLYRRPAAHLLADAFLAVGLAFATLALPLAFDRVLVGAIWVLEGAALVWTGARQRKAWMRWGGLGLQGVAAAVLFRQGVLDPDAAFGPETLTGWIVAVALGLSAFVLHRWPDLFDWERFASRLLLVAALLWWGAAGFIHTVDLASDRYVISVLVGFAAVSAAALLAGGRALRWPALRIAAFGLVPVGGLLWTAELLGGDVPFADLGWLAWPMALTVAVAALIVNRSAPTSLHTAATAGTLWLIAAVLAAQASWVSVWGLDGVAWSLAAIGLVLAACLIGPLVLPEVLRERIAARRGWTVGLWGLALAIATWLLVGLGLRGETPPLAYLPILNPLGVATAAGVAALVGLARSRTTRTGRQTAWALAAGVGFVAVTTGVARSVHHVVGVGYSGDALFGSPSFQAAIAVVWTVLALALTVAAVRRGSRPMWMVGAALLGVVVVKLFLVDLSQTDSLVRIGAFFGVGLLGLWIAYQAPLPPRREDTSAAPAEPVSSGDPVG